MSIDTLRNVLQNSNAAKTNYALVGAALPFIASITDKKVLKSEQTEIQLMEDLPTATANVFCNIFYL